MLSLTGTRSMRAATAHFNYSSVRTENGTHMSNAISYDGGLTAALTVTDLDAAIAWYTDVLGMELIYKLDEMGWAEVRSAVKGVNVGLSRRETVEKGGGAILTWGVTDIGAARASLEANGVQFDGPTQTIPEMVSLANFADPFGNTMSLYQDLAPAAG